MRRGLWQSSYGRDSLEQWTPKPFHPVPIIYGERLPEAIASPPAYQRARAAVRDDEVARTLVHALKYQDRTDLAPAMGRRMARAGRELLAGADMLIGVRPGCRYPQSSHIIWVLFLD